MDTSEVSVSVISDGTVELLFIDEDDDVQQVMIMNGRDARTVGEALFKAGCDELVMQADAAADADADDEHDLED